MVVGNVDLEYFLRERLVGEKLDQFQSGGEVVAVHDPIIATPAARA